MAMNKMNLFLFTIVLFYSYCNSAQPVKKSATILDIIYSQNNVLERAMGGGYYGFGGSSNVVEYTWKNLNNGADNGKLLEVSYLKKRQDSSLRVTWSGNLRAYGSSKCSRWFFSFNGNECSNPAKIELVEYVGTTSVNRYENKMFQGSCHGIAAGNMKIQLNVGSCSTGHGRADAYTGWSSISRITVEEINVAKGN